MHATRRRLLFAIFALSGFSGLIYETIWTHYLKLFLGHAAYAQSLVIGIFMGGMAVGSWICARWSARWRRVLLGYAATELAVGLLALVFHPFFVGVVGLAENAILPRLGSAAAIDAFKWTLSSALILPQSVLLGMTFPLMSAGLIRGAPDRPGRSLAMLYFTNSAGAAVGVLVSGFALIRWIGLPGTVCVAGLVNVALAALVWWADRGAGLERPPIVEEAPRASAGGLPERGWFGLLLAAAFVTGLSSFLYEIGWIRMLSLVLGASTQAFELMLSAFILGLALGGLWLERRVDAVRDTLRWLAFVQVLMGVLALATLPVYGRSFELMRWLMAVLERTDAGYVEFNVVSNAIAMAVMMPASFCAGMTLPLITVTLLRRGHGERSIGAVYAANTLGAIVGVLAAIHVAMPALGLKGVLTLGAAMDVGLGLFLFSRSGWRDRRAFAASALGTAAVAVTLAFVTLDPYRMASGVYRNGTLLSAEGSRVLFHRDGKTATVSVVAEADGSTSLRTNGKADAAIMTQPGGIASYDEATMILLGVIPMSVAPQARTAAVIGMGSGLTTHTLLGDPLLASVDTVEIEEEMIHGARLFSPVNDRAFADPRSRIFVEDAKTFFSSHQTRYDLVVSEPSNPWVSGVAGLFSTEFYRLVKHHMNPHAVFAQWVQLYEINVELVVSVLKAIDESFEDYAVYATNEGDLVIVAEADAPVQPVDEGVLAWPRIAEELTRVRVAGAQDLESRKVGTKRLLHRFIRSFGIRANSDYYPVLDQNATRARFLEDDATALVDFTRVPFPVVQLAEPQRWAQTAITLSEQFERSRLAVQAMAVRDLVANGGAPGAARGLPPQVLAKAEALRARLAACAAPRGDSPGLEAVFDLLLDVVPHLSPADLHALIAPLDSDECARSLSPIERQCYAVLRAIAGRDGQALASAARAMLASAGQLTPDGVRLLVGYGMLGSLLDGDRAGACRLWSEHAPVLARPGTDDLQLRLLSAECGPG